METITLLILLCIMLSSSSLIAALIYISTQTPPPATVSTPAPSASEQASTPAPASAPVSTPAPAQAATPPASAPVPVQAPYIPASTPVPASTSAPIPASTPAPAPAPGTDCNQIPLYRLYNGSISDHMDSLSNNEASPYYTLDGQIATICSNQAQGTTGLYRGYKKNGQHMSTTTLSELTNNGFTVDFNSQPMGYVYTNFISPNAKPIYRLYNSSNSDHMTSPNLNEAAPSYLGDWNGSPMFYSLK